MTIRIHGIHPVLEALRKRPRAFHQVLVSRRCEGRLRHTIESLSQQAGICVRHVLPRELTRTAGSPDHQGLVAEVEPFPLIDLKTVIARYCNKDAKTFLVVADSVQDPHNLGSIIRSAVCSGAQALVFPKDRTAGLTGSVAKASAGAIEHLPLCRVVNVSQALDRLKKSGVWIAGTAPESSKTIYDADLTMDLALVIGGEAKGLRALTRRQCDFSLAIPMAGDFDSLNASVAGAVALFEVLRQRRQIAQ